jgi:hypothetical protein
LDYILVHRSIPLRIFKEFGPMKKIALFVALAFAAPLAANAATVLTPHDQLVQKIQNTYHTSFPNNGN